MASQLFSKYDPANINMPDDRQVYGKGRDPWSMKVDSLNSLEQCLDLYKRDYYMHDYVDPEYPSDKLDGELVEY